MTPAGRNVDDILENLAEAIAAAAELVGLGQERWDAERPLRLAGEAVVGRLGDIATPIRASTTTECGGRSATTCRSWTGSYGCGSARSSARRSTAPIKRGRRSEANWSHRVTLATDAISTW